MNKDVMNMMKKTIQKSTYVFSFDKVPLQKTLALSAENICCACAFYVTQNQHLVKSVISLK